MASARRSSGESSVATWRADLDDSQPAAGVDPGAAQTSVLIVEDDEAIGAALQRVLCGQGLRAGLVGTGGGALESLSADVGLVILDLGLPDMDGIDVCRSLRSAWPSVAILMLTARDHELDVVAGLDAGADDYIVKPFRLSELLARVRAHLRRHGGPRAGLGTVGAGEIVADGDARRAWRGERELVLRPKEFDLLWLLLGENGRVVTRERLMSEVWDTEWMGSTKTLDMHIHALRQKIGPASITTLRGVGYRLESG